MRAVLPPARKSHTEQVLKNSELAEKALSRTERKKARTRTRLIEAAYAIMSAKGIDDATIQEITDRADVGFGTFYNYFETKDDIAAQVLDCVIDDLGRRNDEATQDLKGGSPAAVQAISIRITMREMLINPMWKWWLKRPELLAERLRKDFYRYGMRDLKIAVAAGRYDIAADELDTVWSQQMWMLTGGVRDMLDNGVKGLDEKGLIRIIMRAMGLPAARAKELADLDVPEVRLPDIDFSFVADDNG